MAVFLSGDVIIKDSSLMLATWKKVVLARIPDLLNAPGGVKLQ